MNLHQEFKKLAFDINKMKNRLMALLLEIYQKEIYKKHECSTIYEYGFKYAKFSKDTVQLALRTLKNTEDKPFLREKIETQGIYKVSMVAKLATPKTDKLYADHVENMSKPVLFEFAKEMRNVGGNGFQEKSHENFQENLLKNFDEKYSIKCHAVASKMTIELDEEAQILFNQLKKQYAKELSNKEALKIILKNVPGNGILKNFKISKQIAQQNKQKKINNQRILATTEHSEKNQQQPNVHLPTSKPTKPSREIYPEKQIPTRYIRIKNQRQIHQKTNDKCAYPACTRPIENLHHPIPFSFNRSHESVVGLCKIHHAFCHNGIIKNELKDPSEWELNLAPQRSLFDDLYFKYKT